MLTTSPSPHYQSNTSTSKLMRNVLIALIPAFILSSISSGADMEFSLVISFYNCEN